MQQMLFAQNQIKSKYNNRLGLTFFDSFHISIARLQIICVRFFLLFILLLHVRLSLAILSLIIQFAVSCLRFARRAILI